MKIMNLQTQLNQVSATQSAIAISRSSQVNGRSRSWARARPSWASSNSKSRFEVSLGFQLAVHFSRHRNT